LKDKINKFHHLEREKSERGKLNNLPSMSTSNSLVEVLRLLELMGSFDTSEEKRGNVAQLKAAIG